jgi:hypothetical protein
MNELEVDRHGLEVRARLCTVGSDFKEGIVEAFTIGILVADSGELLVGGVVRRGDIVGEKPSVGHDMAKTNNIPDVYTMSRLYSDGASGGHNLPQVVGVVVGISSDLLTLRGDTAVVVAKRIPVRVTVKIDLGVLVADVDGIVVVDADRLLCHDVVAERLLELGAHKVVARSRTGQDGKVDLEPEEVEHEGDDYQASNAGGQVLAEFRQTKGALSTVDVEE